MLAQFFILIVLSLLSKIEILKIYSWIENFKIPNSKEF